MKKEAPINTYDQMQIAKSLGIEPVAISKEMGGARRDYVAGVCVWHLTHHTDPDAHWTHQGKRFFSLISRCAGGQQFTFKDRLRAAEDEAKAWAKTKYGVERWERNRMGDLVPYPLNTKHKLRSLKEPPPAGEASLKP